MLLQNTKKAQVISWAFIFFIIIFLTSCHVFRDPIETARLVTENKNFVEENIRAGDFVIKTFHKPFAGNGKVLTIYIEGDGSAWKNRYTPSKDPSPKKNPLSLKLAVADPNNNVAYVARPCQYVLTSNCHYSLWTEARFNKQMLNALSETIDKLKIKSQTEEVKVIGFSGGGTMAMLLPSIRDDITEIMTVGAVLDHKKWTEWHKVSPLKSSLNPIDYISYLKDIKQTHYCGGKDKISPCELHEKFLQHYGDQIDDIKVIRVKGNSHQCCWQDNWPSYLMEKK